MELMTSSSQNQGIFTPKFLYRADAIKLFGVNLLAFGKLNIVGKLST